MAEINEDASATRTRLGQIFETVAISMKTSAEEENYLTASEVAERLGLVTTPPSKPIGHAWQTIENGYTLWFQWRYYDQSRPFSIQKDMTILSLELREGDKGLRRAEERYED
jgi:hypothetical protein